MTAIPFIRRTARERVDGTLTVTIDIEPLHKMEFLRMFSEIGQAGALAALVVGTEIFESSASQYLADHFPDVTKKVSNKPGGELGAPMQTRATERDEPKTKPGELCVIACRFCADPEFWIWINCHENLATKITCEEYAKHWILEECGIDSRKELDTNTKAAEVFHKYIRAPFLEWKKQ